MQFWNVIFANRCPKKRPNLRTGTKKSAQLEQMYHDAVKDVKKHREACDWVGIRLVQMLEGKPTPEQAADAAPGGALHDKKAFIEAIKKMSDSKNKKHMAR